MPNNPRYWILSDVTPLGPFDASEIQAKSASAEFTPAMKFCRVGDREWLPPASFSAHIAIAESGPPLPAEPVATTDQEASPASSLDPARAASPPPVNPWIGPDVIIGAGVLATVLLLIGLPFGG